ncbi:hypothetical protein [Saccharicrinis sp. GN24d3]|uniref:hypothetical protein n=1 Tax=Saccharicrinis sp. GN24d3 TaxID=3458416 RepID=UPI0040357412
MKRPSLDIFKIQNQSHNGLGRMVKNMLFPLVTAKIKKMKPKIFVLFLLFISLMAGAQTIRVVNMVPNALSNESSQDSEPNIGINPNNPLQIIGTAFTSNPTGVNNTAPIYISQDGGNTWVLNNIVPSLNGNTGDITVGLSRNNILYAGILTGGYFNPASPNETQMQMFRSNNYLAPAVMNQLMVRIREDQPYVEVITPLGGAQRNNDHVYVGHNDFNAASNRTASLEQSLNAATAPAPANLNTIRLEVRNPFGQDGPPIRTAAHPNGTVYAIFYMRTNSVGSTRTGNVVVVRDNNWGQGTPSYNDLTDPGDGLAGIRVATGINWTWSGPRMGQERIGDRASIAVDPRNSQTVYIAYVDLAPGAVAGSTRLHVRRSTNGGANWSADLLTINNVICPQLAVNIRGDVGILYQQLTGVAPNQQWTTLFRQSNNGGANWNNNTLSQAPSNTPVRAFSPYLGDYAGLKSVGKDFYGVFSANNTPNNANFPNGVTYQRNANFTTNNLRNLANTANVNVSIDPFFFEVQQIPDNRDFYVRDWTTNATTLDIGLEPSTNPVFYATSDVWNRRLNAAGGFNTNDQPQSLDPQISTLGNNFAFARVHRKGTGTAETVTLHFLKSELGTGSNYVNANTTANPTLSFASGELVKTMTSGYEWTLTNSGSTHTCLAVETNTTNDPVVTPTLLGRAPGWPNTDLSVLYDNNKGQRNMGVYSTGTSPEGGFITYYAILHNAATYVRDFILQYEINNPFARHFKRPKFEFPGIEQGVEVGNDRVVISKMKPGENRWIGITVPASVNLGDQMAAINFTEVVDNIAVNGFAIAVVSGPDKEAIFDNYRLHAEVFFRMGHLFELNDALEESEKTIEDLIKPGANPNKYLAYIKDHKELIQKLTGVVLDKNGGIDPLGVKLAFTELVNSVSSGDPAKLMIAHAGYNHKMDAFLTYLDKKNGDVADILQNMYWQLELYKSIKVLKEMDGSKELIKQSDKFYQAFNTNQANYRDYSELINNLMDVYRKTAEVVEPFRINLTKELRAMNSSLRNPQHLQKAHYDLLIKLNSLRK